MHCLIDLKIIIFHCCKRCIPPGYTASSSCGCCGAQFVFDGTSNIFVVTPVSGIVGNQTTSTYDWMTESKSSADVVVTVMPERTFILRVYGRTRVHSSRQQRARRPPIDQSLRPHNVDDYIDDLTSTTTSAVCGSCTFWSAAVTPPLH